MPIFRPVRPVRPLTHTRKNPDPSFSGTGMAGYGYGSVIFTRGLPGIFTICELEFCKKL